MSWPIGKTWDLGTTPILEEHARLYADATGDDAAAYAEGVAPPMLHVRLMRPLLWGIATGEELALDVLRLVHGEHGMTFARPLHVGEEVHVHGELVDVQEKSSGLLVVSALYGDVGDERVLEGRTAYFIRAKNPPPRKEGSRPAPPDPGPPAWSGTVLVPEDASHRYAVASLDDNPIHVDREVAAKAGLPDVILQGLCTMAMSVREAVRAHGGDPRRLSEASVRFARPVFNGQTLRVHGWADGSLATLGPEGKPVLTGRVAFRA